VSAKQTDDVGRVVDFSVLKDRVGGWIDAHWDHAFLHHHADTAVTLALAYFEDYEGVGFVQKRHVLPFNPTAENMASYLLDVVCPEVLEGTGVRVVEVTMWETENCFATAKESA
jgi:6-pyruvoyltetrahydropterin/6-carboxytetrahydropterin synthase